MKADLRVRHRALVTGRKEREVEVRAFRPGNLGVRLRRLPLVEVDTERVAVEARRRVDVAHAERDEHQPRVAHLGIVTRSGWFGPITVSREAVSKGLSLGHA